MLRMLLPGRTFRFWHCDDRSPPDYGRRAWRHPIPPMGCRPSFLRAVPVPPHRRPSTVLSTDPTRRGPRRSWPLYRRGMPAPFVVRPRDPRVDDGPAPDPRGVGVARSEGADVAAAPPPVAVTSRPPVVRVPRHPVLAPLVPFLDDPEVTDVFVNGTRGLFVDRGDGPVAVAGWRTSEDDVRDLATALVSLGGRHLDDASPAVDVRLEGGLRVHAVLPPLAAQGTAISIRVPRLASASLDALQERGMFGAAGRRRLEEIVVRRENLLIGGAAGAGKTTLLAALLARAPHRERIVTIEDVAELRIDHPHHVPLEARQPNLEGVGGIDLARLVREALRMRPDRLVVGECRGAEVRELLAALNTGHDGGAGTIHANGIADVPARLEALAASCGLDDRALARQAASAIDAVIFVARSPDGSRRIVASGRPVVGAAGRLEIEEAPWHDA